MATTPNGSYSLTDDGREAIRVLKSTHTNGMGSKGVASSIRRTNWTRPLVGGLLIALVILGGFAAYQQQQIGLLEATRSTDTRSTDSPSVANIALSPSSGPVGARVNITGSLYPYVNCGGNFTFDGISIAAFHTDGNVGNYSTRFTVPPSSHGSHVVWTTACGGASAVFAVVNATTNTSTSANQLYLHPSGEVAGYESLTNSTYTSANITVPTVYCDRRAPSDQAAFFLVGIGRLEGGLIGWIGGFSALCLRGSASPVYSVWPNWLTRLSIHPGDVLSIGVSVGSYRCLMAGKSGIQSSVTIKDITTGNSTTSYSRSHLCEYGYPKLGNYSHLSVVASAMEGINDVPLARFSDASYSGWLWGSSKIFVMTDLSGATIDAEPSALTGSSFTIYWRSP